MIDTRVLSSDPVTGITNVMHYDDDTGDFVIETAHDVTAITEGAKALHADMDERARWRDGLNHVGWIPLPMLHALKKGCGSYEERQHKLRQYLNDPAFRDFRSRPGRV